MKHYKIVVIDIVLRTIANNKAQALKNFQEQITGAQNLGIFMNPEWAKIENIKTVGRVL